MTNSGCESNFAQLDLECRRGGGQTTLQTMYNRHIVFFNTEKWKQMKTDVKNKAWKKARSGEQANVVKSMQKEFLELLKL